jgi:hypothetical protein
MNTTKSVYNRLFKEEATELASHEVELASVQDLEKAIKEATNQSDVYLKLLGDIDSYEKEIQAKKQAMLTKAEGVRRELNNKKNILGDTWSDFNQKAKELGIDAKGIPVFKNADTAFMKLEKESRDLSDIIVKKLGGKF